MNDDWETAELGACLMVTYGCRVVSVVDAVVSARRRRAASERLF